jgi:glutamine amidotransferase
MDARVTVVDYGMGNLWSVVSAVKYLGGQATLSSDPNEVVRARTLILPGVGSFRLAMEALTTTGLAQAMVEAVTRGGSRMLGICLGMQLMGLDSTEDGQTAGLGLIPARVDRFSSEEVGTHKVPHIGFNAVQAPYAGGLFRGIPEGSDFYFVQSYRLLPQGLSGHAATCSYGIDFLAAYEDDRVAATQFHPEKSQTNGLALLRNFLAQSSGERC